jgi:hypothetical protein
MPEHIRAFIAVLAIAVPALWVARTVFCASVLDRREYDNLRLAWFCTTAIVFLSCNFWLYVVLAGIALTVFRKRAENPLLVYCVVLFVAPPFLKPIPGVGGIEQIIAVDLYRVLALTVLLPAVLWRSEAASPLQMPARPARAAPGGRRKVARESRWGTTDQFMLTFLGWLALVRIANDSVTGDIRGIFYLITDYWLPYYAASRLVTSVRQIQQVIAAFCIAALIVAFLAMFESERLWLLYKPLAPLFDMQNGTMYLVRGSGSGGTLRAEVSLGQPIPLGYVLAVAMMLFSGIAAQVPLLAVRVAFYGAYLGGLVASMSRGPWSGAAVGLISMLFVGKSATKRVLQFLLWSPPALTLFLLSPWADNVTAYLPFVGTVDTGNIDYRDRLIDVSLELLGRNPLVGNFFYLTDPLLEQMRTGEGIIDMVNTYLQVALPYGCIGLALFAGVFVSAMVNLLRICRRIEDPEAVRVARALFGALVSVMITIGTVSSISAIDKVYFLTAGLCVGYARALKAQLSLPVRQTPVSRPAAAMPRSVA